VSHPAAACRQNPAPRGRGLEEPASCGSEFAGDGQASGVRPPAGWICVAGRPHSRWSTRRLWRGNSPSGHKWATSNRFPRCSGCATYPGVKPGADGIAGRPRIVGRRCAPAGSPPQLTWTRREAQAFARDGHRAEVHHVTEDGERGSWKPRPLVRVPTDAPLAHHLRRPRQTARTTPRAASAVDVGGPPSGPSGSWRCSETLVTSRSTTPHITADS